MHIMRRSEPVRKRSGGRCYIFGRSDDWGALCEFLEVRVPIYPYPRKNEGGDWIVGMRERAWMRAKAATIRPIPVDLPVAVVVFGAWAMAAKISGALVP